MSLSVDGLYSHCFGVLPERCLRDKPFAFGKVPGCSVGRAVSYYWWYSYLRDIVIVYL